jgi:hypothetical protein
MENVTPNESSAVPADEAHDAGGEQSSQSPRDGTWGMSATYSPDDNKLRLSSMHRLDAATYQRVKAAGFIWAPKQDIFVAPMWTPARADLLLELCGSIGDEDTSLCERADQRAERFEGYQERRTSDAEAAERAFDAITAHIPLGQPILVGHHSERRARKDAERIEAGMRKAVQMWDTAAYWRRRAAGAVHHARYKERPDVRYRRIKGLETDRRRQEKRIAEAEGFVKLWERPDLTRSQAMAVANYDHVNLPREGTPWRDSICSLLREEKLTAEEAAKAAVAHHTREIAAAKRWLEHINNRIAYERAMLGEDGDIPAARFNVEVGGEVLIDGKWCIVLRVNSKEGAPVSLRATCPYSSRGWVRGIEEVRDYRPPTGDQAAKVKAATKLPPLCNYPGEGFLEMTQAQWNRISRDYKATRVEKACERFGAHRCRRTIDHAGGGGLAQVYLTDVKRTEPPPPAGVESPELPPPRPTLLRAVREKAAEPRPGAAMRERLRQGVLVVSAPELFPTPSALAARMVELAALSDDHTLLEPSAGTGALLEAVKVAGRVPQTTAVELNHALADALRARGGLDVRQADFLECGADLGEFDRVLMNPPFGKAQDIAHIELARRLLKPGGILVAICAGGPRQHAALRPLVQACGGHWEELPADTFPGTSVRSVLLTLTRPAG